MLRETSGRVNPVGVDALKEEIELEKENCARSLEDAVPRGASKY